MSMSCARVCSSSVVARSTSSREASAALEPALRQIERFFKGSHVGIEQLFLRVKPAQRQVVQRKFRMKAQVHGFQIGGRGLRLRAAGLHDHADPAPHVRFVGHIPGEKKIRVIGRRGCALAARGRWIGAGGWPRRSRSRAEIARSAKFATRRGLPGSGPRRPAASGSRPSTVLPARSIRDPEKLSTTCPCALRRWARPVSSFRFPCRRWEFASWALNTWGPPNSLRPARSRGTAPAKCGRRNYSVRVDQDRESIPADGIMVASARPAAAATLGRPGRRSANPGD